MVRAALVAPLLLVAAILFHTFLALPLLDDYGASLGFLLRQQALKGFIPKLLGAIADQQYQYKFLLFHFALLAQHLLTGHLSFTPLVIIGDLLFLPLLYTLAANAFPHLPRQSRLPLLLPVAYFSCQLTFAEVFNWALASLNCLSVVVFAALSLHYLVRVDRPHSRVHLGLACLSFVLSCASSTSGLLLAPLGLIFLLRAKQRRAAVVWCGTAVFSFALYLYRLQPVPHLIGPISTQLLFLLSFVGGAVENMHRWPFHGAAVVLGGFLLAVFADAVRTGYPRHNPFFFWLAAWALCTAVAAANFRSSLGVSQSLSGRYKIYSMLVLVFAYVYLAERALKSRTLSLQSRKALFAGALAASVLFNLAGNINGVRFLERRKQWVEAGMRQYGNDPIHQSPLPTSAPEYLSEAEAERNTLSAAIANRIYTIPASHPAK